MPGSTPIVGRTTLRPEVTRTGVDHVFPSADREMTTSFAAQPVRKRQSCHAVSTEPVRSSSAAISGGARNGRASRGVRREMRTGSSSVTPPSVEVTDTIPVPPDQNVSTSFPSAWITGITPVTGSCWVTAADQVRPPSSERCTASRSMRSPTSV